MQQVTDSASVKFDIILCGCDPIHVFDIHEHSLAPYPHHQALHVAPRRRDGFEQAHDLSVRICCYIGTDTDFGAHKRFDETFFDHRLEQVIKRIDFKCLNCILVVGGHENHLWHMLCADSPNHLECVHLRHLYIQKHEVVFGVSNCSDRLSSISSFAN